jgi:hypothetical protein
MQFWVRVAIGLTHADPTARGQLNIPAYRIFVVTESRYEFKDSPWMDKRLRAASLMGRGVGL